jgi:hypothetical protein
MTADDVSGLASKIEALEKRLSKKAPKASDRG